MTTWSSSFHGIPAGTDDPLVSSQRAVSRLKSVFISLFSQADNLRTVVNQFAHPNGETGGADHPNTVGNLDCIPDAKDVQFQLILNGETMPVMPCRSRSESFSQLLKAIGCANSTYHSVCITDASYQTTEYIQGFDMEKVISASLTGRDTRTGPSQLSVQLKNLSQGGAVASSDQITKVFFSSCFDVVVEIRDTGITILS